MRIGYLTYGLDNDPTGIGRYSIELLRALAGLPGGPEIVLLTTEPTDPHGLWSNFEHHPLPGCRLLPALLTLGNGLLSLAARKYRLDIIHDPNGIAPFFGPAWGARRLVTIHDAFAYVYPQAHNRLDNWRYRWLLPNAAKRADLVLTVSTQSSLDIQQYLDVIGSRIRVVSNAVNSHFQPIVNEQELKETLERYSIERPYLLYVGGINARKNIVGLFEAFARLGQRYPGLKLVIGGKRQWQTGEIDATFRRLNLHDKVHFTGYVPDSDLPALYSAAEAFVFPSLYEGFGLPPLEAMACGTPVITSNVSSLPEVVGDAALTVSPTDTSGLTGAIERILTDTRLRATLRARGFERAARFSWAHTARQTLAAYKFVLEQKSLTKTLPNPVYQEEKL